MLFFTKVKDGGPESPVDAFVLIELKSLFSIMILKFNKGKRESFHSHAFNALTWFVGGELEEELLSGIKNKYKMDIIPKYTKKENVHRVKATKDSWCISIRGPWEKYWWEYDKTKEILTVLSNKRKIINQTTIQIK